MEASTHGITPLRQRMIEDMCMRRMQDRTQEAYIRGVRRLARFLGRSPDGALCAPRSRSRTSSAAPGRRGEVSSAAT